MRANRVDGLTQSQLESGVGLSSQYHAPFP
jgi:hypothetical protein